MLPHCDNRQREEYNRSMARLYTFTALTTLLALMAMHFFVVLALGYSLSTHTSGMQHHDMGTMHQMNDCPFMTHGETFCPMTVLDHLTAFRSLFESILPTLVVLSLIMSASSFWHSLVPRLRPLLLLPAHVFLRWRTHVLYQFVYRQYQGLFARGILHQKVYG